MRIGVNTLFLIPGEVGGSETYLRQTLQALAAEFAGDEFVLFTNLENAAVLQADLAAFRNVSYVPLLFEATNRYARIIREQSELPWKAGRAGVDVLWSPGYVAPCFCRCPQVVTIHDMQYRRYPQDLPLLNRLVTDVLIRMSVRRCRRILAISEFGKQEVTTLTSTPPERVDVSFEGVNPDFGERLSVQERDALLARLGGVKPPFILGVSNTYPHKNIPVLIEAFGRVMDRIPHKLVFVGNPRLGEPAVQQVVAGLSDRSRVIRLSKLDVRQLYALYQEADVFVFPSLYEGFGLPVAEAMLARTPVITTRCGSIPEVGGVFVDYFDGHDPAALGARILATLALSAADREARVSKAAEWARRFTWSQTARLTMASLRKASDFAD